MITFKNNHESTKYLSMIIGNPYSHYNITFFKYANYLNEVGINIVFSGWGGFHISILFCNITFGIQIGHQQEFKDID